MTTAPDCARIELTSLTEEKDEKQLLYAMGWETANIHLGGKSAVAAVKADLKNHKMGWLAAASDLISKSVIDDRQAWKA